MSIQFEKPMNEETVEAIKKAFGKKIAVMDRKNVLLENLSMISQKKMSAIAKKAKQPITLNLHDNDDIVEMSDGTKYQVTNEGWRKV